MTAKHSKITFNIVEQKGINYEAAKQDYINGIKGVKLQKKHNIGTSQYTRLLDRFRADGIEIPRYKTPTEDKPHCNPSNVHRVLCKGIMYWAVKKTINYNTYHFGQYKSRAEAEERVRELQANNWEGLMDL